MPLQLLVIYAFTPGALGILMTQAIFVMTMLIGGPLAEEIGWRGFAVDRLMKHRKKTAYDS